MLIEANFRVKIFRLKIRRKKLQIFFKIFLKDNKKNINKMCFFQNFKKNMLRILLRQELPKK